MKKSELAKKIWFNITRREKLIVELDKLASTTTAQRILKILKYYFYLILFKWALVEFYANLYVGKFFILCFNGVNKHKIRVNALVQSAADKIKESQQ